MFRNLGTSLLDPWRRWGADRRWLREGVFAYDLQKRLDVECKKLEAQSAALARHADAWVALVGDMNQALKEVGDVDNWARAIEADVTQCAATLERVYRTRGGAGDGPALGEGVTVFTSFGQFF
ncbi:hypothetical protein niasHS_016342 [Heterodera schachtii]|uniref:Biogenesis of lysosome-related organelles complex 1 subunit 1 n=1 Tax=Heterodera schachtii TaxID=97005 RepID=A0ABD2HYB8_HETSC